MLHFTFSLLLSGFCETESPPRVFCIICRRQTTALSPRSVWPLTSPFSPPFNSRAANHSNTGSSAGYESTAIEPSLLDLKTKHKAKIVVSPTEKSPRLSPKRPSPRQDVKRSLSFSYSSPKDATKPLQRTARSASSPERLRLQDDSARPRIQSDISRDSDERQSNFITNDSQVIGCGLREVKSLNLDYAEDGKNSLEVSTAELEEGLKTAPDTQETLSTELTRLLTLGKQKDTANCSHSDSESEKPLVKHTNANTSPNVLSVSFSSMCRRERHQTGELVETPSVVADECPNDPCLSNETGSRTLTNTASPPDISQLESIWDLHDNLQTVDMEISESLPSSITVGQAYSFSTPHAFNGVSTAQASLEKVVCSKTILPESSTTESVQNMPVTVTAKQLLGEAAGNSTTNPTNFIAHTVSPANDQLVVLCETKSPDTDSTNHGDDVGLSREPESHDIVMCVDMSISTDDESEVFDKNDGSETLDRNLICENHNWQTAMLANSQLLQNSSKKNSDWSKSLSIDEGARSREQSVSSMCKGAEAGGSDSEMSLDCAEGNSLSFDRPYSFKSSPDTVEKQSKPRNSVLSGSAANILIQKNCSLDENTSLSTSCAQSCSKVLESSLSPRKFPKLCIERLKALQGALKTATGLNANQPDRNTCSPCKLVIHPQNTKEPEPDKDCVERFDSMGVSVTEQGSEGTKPPMFGLSAVETQDSVIPTKSQPCEGGVIEMSLIEDWGFVPGSSSCNETHLTDEAFGPLDVEEEEYEIDSIDGDPVVEPFETGPYIDECDIPEPEVVVCSPSEPMETFTFRFPGIPAVDEDENGMSETTDDKTHLVEESLVVPEFCTEVVVSSLENFVSEVGLPEESSLENESEIPESVVVVEGDTVDSVVCISHSSQNLANGCLSKLPKKDVFCSGDVKELENTGSKQQCSERLEDCEKVCLGPLLKRDEQQIVEAAKAERPVGQPVILKGSQMIESTKDRDVRIYLNSDRGPCEITKQKRSSATLEDALQVQMDDIIVGSSEVELPAHERKGGCREVSLPNVQETEKGSGCEGLLSEIQVKRNGTDDERDGTVTSEEKEEVDNRCSVMTLPETRDPGYSIEKEKQDCLVKGKEMTSRDIAIGDESEAMHLSTSSPRLLQAETNLTHNKTVEGKSERLKNTEKLLGKAEEEGREINRETESRNETEKESCPDNVFSKEREEEIKFTSTLQNRVEKTKCSGFFLNCHIVENSEELEPVKDMTKSPVQSVRKSNFGNVESKSVSSATTTQWTVKSLDRSGTTGMGINEANETFLREHLKQEPLDSTRKNLVSSTPKNKTRKKERKVNNSFSVVPSPRESKVETAKDDSSSRKLAEKTSKREEVKKPSERTMKSAVVSDTVEANVKCKVTEKGDTLGTNIVKSAGTPSVISTPPSSNKKSDAQASQVKSKVCHQGVYYQDTQNKSEPKSAVLSDTVEANVKCKVTEKGDTLGTNIVKSAGTPSVISPPPSSNRKSDAQASQVKSKVCHQGVYYQDTQNKSEPKSAVLSDTVEANAKYKETEKGDKLGTNIDKSAGTPSFISRPPSINRKSDAQASQVKSKVCHQGVYYQDTQNKSEPKSAVLSDTVEANAKYKETEKGDKLGTNIDKSAGTPSFISRPPSSNRKSDAQASQVKSKVCHQGVYYQDTQNKTEPLIAMQWDNIVRSMKRKCTEEGYILAKQPKLMPTHNEAVENRGTLKNLTPPPPLVSLDLEMNRSQQVHGMPRAMLCESNIRDPRIHRPYPRRPQFEYMSPTVHYYNERKYFKANTEHHSYPCWVSPLPTPFPVNNRGTEIPPNPWWYQQRGVMPHDHRANRQQFDPVYPIHGNCGVTVPQHGNPAFPPKPGLLPNPWKRGLLPDPWHPRSNPCYTPHPLVTPR